MGRLLTIMGFTALLLLGLSLQAPPSALAEEAGETPAKGEEAAPEKPGEGGEKPPEENEDPPLDETTRGPALPKDNRSEDNE